MAAYVKNRQLRDELIKSKELGELTPECLRMFQLISEKLSMKLTNKRFEDRQDCIQGGVIDGWTYWRGYDASVSLNAFSYMTQVIKNGQFKQLRKINPHKMQFISINNIYTL